MKRRSFLAGIIAAGAAPAIVRASSLMQIVVPRIVVPDNRFWIHEFGWDKGWEAGDRTVIATAVPGPEKFAIRVTYARLGNGVWTPESRVFS
jgi:hypothetical protein